MRFFRVTPPSVHQMVLSLENAGLISRKPGVPRSIVVLLESAALPELTPGDAQPVNFDQGLACFKALRKWRLCSLGSGI